MDAREFREEVPGGEGADFFVPVKRAQVEGVHAGAVAGVERGIGAGKD